MSKWVYFIVFDIKQSILINFFYHEACKGKVENEDIKSKNTIGKHLKIKEIIILQEFV